MGIATRNPPIRIRRITGPAIEASKDTRPSPLATSPPKPASQAKDLGDPTRRYWKRSFGSFASFGPEKTEGNPANDPAKCRPGAMPYSARAAAGLHTIGAKHVQPNSSRSNRHPDRSP